MNSPLKSLLVAIGLLLLGGALYAPYTPVSWRVGADGKRLPRPESERRVAEWRVNWPAYVCLAGAGTAFGWTIFLVAAAAMRAGRKKSAD